MIFEKPKKPTASHVQAEFYRQAVNAGLDVYVEYATAVKEDSGISLRKSGKVRGCRFDAVVILGDRVVCIVECKSFGGGVTELEKTRRGQTLQRAKYRSFNVPVLYVCSMGEIPDAVRRLVNMVSAIKERR